MPDGLDDESTADDPVEDDPRPPATETAQERIVAAWLERSPTLDLGDQELREIPSEVFSMSWLTSLDLSGNRLGAVPDAIARLGNLQELDLWNNSGCRVPEAIGQLSELRRLSIGPGSPELPESIGRCHRLERLAIGSNRLGVLPDWLTSLHELEELQLWSNQLEELPDWWSNFPRLKLLNLAGNRLSTLPAGFGALTRLEKLDLYANRLTSLPPDFGRLARLETLNLERNELSSLPLALSELSGLRTVSLAGNRFRQLPQAITHWRNVEALDLTGNQLASVPPGLGALSKLQELRLAENQLTDLPDALSGLRSLRTVTLGMNRFRALPEVVTRWSNLEILDLTSDPSLRVSHVGDTAFVSGKTGAADELRSELETLPAGLEHLSRLRVLLLFGNPKLGIPDELVGGPGKGRPGGRWAGSVDDLLDYYFRTRGGARPLNEAKLLLLGWGGAGKTSLVNRLVRGTFDPEEARTEGIEVTDWSVRLPEGEEVRLNVWDFGGQEIMHATHQFFLTTRSLYLLVLNGRTGSADGDLDYWMRIVDSFAANSPVIVVLNQIVRDPFELDENGLRQKYPNIRAFVSTDCAVGDEGLGIDGLKAKIVQETDRLPDLRVNFPAAWFEIKNRLATMTENYLTFDQYRRVCSELGEDESEAQDQLANYLHSLGIALNYRDDPRLRDTHVLNPHWVTEGIYAILNSRRVAEQRGEVTIQDLSHVLDPGRYPPERHSFLLDLMRKFELCFPYPEDEDRYLVADLLPKQQPDEVDRFPVEGSLQFEYRYPVLPEGLLPRFIVRSHIHSAGQPRWRTGVVLQWEGNRALVKADIPSRTVRVAVAGAAEGRRRLLAVIRSDFEFIHRSYSFKVDAFVPVGDRPGLSVDYQKLRAAEEAGMASFPEFVAGEFVQVDVAELLTGVNVGSVAGGRGSKRESRDRRRPVKLFVSYSHRDEAHREALASHLKVLQMAGLVDVWHDRRIDAGDDWKGEIDLALEEADVVILLVSADFLASDYVNDVELPRALERLEDGTCRVVPVIVRDSQWRLSKLGPLQALPTDGKPVVNWSNVDTAWRTVGEGLEHVIRELRP